MRATYKDITIEGNTSDEMEIAFSFVERLREIAPNGSAVAPSKSEEEIKLENAYKEKFKTGFRYRPDGKDAGKTRLEALREAVGEDETPEPIEIPPDDGGEVF